MPTSRSNKPNVLVTMGDPSGVGPEVTLKALASPLTKGLANFFVIGDARTLEKAARDMRLRMCRDVIDMRNVPHPFFRYGRMDGAFGRASIDYLDKALSMIGEGFPGPLVTAPINKASVASGGIRRFEGHTEYLAAKTGSRQAVMMFVGERLKVSLVTRHMPLARVPEKLSPGAIRGTILLTLASLKNDFGISRPRIAVAGLNPHAGEGGLYGSEERKIIAPAVRMTSGRGGKIFGPLSPDAIFWDCLNRKYDACVAMYHDQALAPFKLLYFRSGVNMTLGLPFVRTSPDHGTAFDIAGRGAADPTSMIEAIRLACRLAKRRCSPSAS